MLLVDARQHLRSLRNTDVFVPITEQYLGHREADIAAWLRDLSRGPGFRAALTEELSRALGTAARLAWSHALIDAVARVIAGGLVRVAATLPLPASIAFDAADSWGQPSHRVVRFPNAEAALAFLLVAWQDAANQQALRAALQWREAAAVIDGVRQELKGGLPGLTRGAARLDDLDEWRDVIILLLVRRLLVLSPANLARQQFRLVWLQHAPVRPVPADAPVVAPLALPSLTDLIEDIASTIPDAPPDLSAQALALIDASKNGLPFCEECMKAAKGLLNAL